MSSEESKYYKVPFTPPAEFYPVCSESDIQTFDFSKSVLAWCKHASARCEINVEHPDVRRAAKEKLILAVQDCCEKNRRREYEVDVLSGNLFAKRFAAAILGTYNKKSDI